MAKNVMDLIASLEEEDVQVDVAAGDGNLDVVETIEEDGEIAEAADLQDTTDQVADGIAETSDSVEAVDAQVEANEKTLENPEAASDEQVAAQVEASQEALNDALFLMGGKRFRNQNRVSLEGIETNIEKLRYATEGLKDFAKNAWEKIIELFQKFVMFFKRLSAKLVTWYNQSDAKAKGLLKKFDNLDTNVSYIFELTEERAEKLAKSSGTFGVILVTKSDINKTGFVSSISKSLAYSASQHPVMEPTVKSTAANIKSFFNFDPSFDEDDDGVKETLIAVIPVGNKLYAVSSFGNTEVEDVDTDKIAKYLKDNIKSLVTQTGPTSARNILDSLSKSSKRLSKDLNDALKNFDKDIKELTKAKNQELKGSSYEDKVDIRKEYNRAYKYKSKLLLLSNKADINFVQGGLALFAGILSAAKGKGVETGGSKK